jgi:hypothetical protein
MDVQRSLPPPPIDAFSQPFLTLSSFFFPVPVSPSPSLPTLRLI